MRDKGKKVVGDASKKYKSDEGHLSLSIVSAAPVKATADEQRMKIDIEVRAPSPSVEEVMEEPAQESKSTRNVEIKEREFPREFLDGIVTGPKETEDKFDESGME